MKTPPRWVTAARPAPRRRLALIGAATGLVLLGGVGGGTYALWSAALTETGLSVSSGQVGIGAGRLDGQLHTASSGSEAISIPLTASDARALVATDGRSITIPFRVVTRADGNADLRYTVTMPEFAAGTLFEDSELRVFPLPDAAEDATATAACTPDAAPAEGGPSALAGGGPGSGASVVSTDYWCLSIRHTGDAGTYQNTAHVTTRDGTVTDEDTWSAFVVEPGELTITHEVILP